MEPTDVTAEILKTIRDDVRATRTDLSARIDKLDARVDKLDARVDGLARVQVEVEVRLSTELAAVTGMVREMRDMMRDDFSLRRRVDDHEVRLVAIEHGPR